jgi:hypothetical protein
MTTRLVYCVWSDCEKKATWDTFVTVDEQKVLMALCERHHAELVNAVQESDPV